MQRFHQRWLSYVASSDRTKCAPIRRSSLERSIFLNLIRGLRRWLLVHARKTVSSSNLLSALPILLKRSSFVLGQEPPKLLHPAFTVSLMGQITQCPSHPSLSPACDSSDAVEEKAACHGDYHPDGD